MPNLMYIATVKGNLSAWNESIRRVEQRQKNKLMEQSYAGKSVCVECNYISKHKNRFKKHDNITYCKRCFKRLKLYDRNKKDKSNT